jgi:hypothetical protein
MTDPAVLSNEQHQRKEVRRKETTMLTRRKREVNDWKIPRVWRAAIYLREPSRGEKNRKGHVPSIHYQGVVCRCAATVLHAEVVGEYVDRQLDFPSRPAVDAVLRLARTDARLDYLIVSSLDRLVGDGDEAFATAWWLGFAGTVVIPADAEDEFPWTGSTPSRT